jgi:Zn-dependent alcohol dehydrogenase
MKITAALLTAPHEPFRLETLDLDGPKSGEVLVQLAATGVCHSDYHLVTGATQHPMPVVPGHEGAGTILDVGPNVPKHLSPGTPVILNWAPACDTCFYCTHHQPNLCETFTAPIWQGRMLDGTTRLKWNGKEVFHWCGLAAFATHAVVPHQALVPIRKDIPPTIAALVGCAVTTGIGAVLYTARANPSDTLAVIGCGGVGLSALLGFSSLLAPQSDRPPTLIAVDANPAKEPLARSCGATHFLPAARHWPEHLRDLTEGRGADVVIEAVGSPATQEDAFASVRPGGTLVLAGLAPMGSPTNLPGALITRQEKTIKGSYYGSCDPRQAFPYLLDQYAANRLPLDRLVSRHYPLSQINDAYQHMLTAPTARGVIVF